MKSISKSKYMSGIGCPVLFWKLMHEPDTLPAFDAATEARFAGGHVVGELAKELYPTGVDLPTDDFSENIRITTELVKERKTLFEAGFSADGLYCRSDVLVPKSDGTWELIEVKATTHAKPPHTFDLAFQQHVLELCGLKISSAAVLHLNNEYVRRGELDIEQLFAKTDITDKVLEELPNVAGRVEMLRKVQALAECPQLDAFGECNAFYDCPVHGGIELPAGHVNELTGKGKVLTQLKEMEVEMLADVPDDFELKPRHVIQVQAARTGRVHVEPESIREFIGALNYPLWHFDFETYQFAVPVYDESRPYQQLPFQYSLHEEHADGTVVHHEFLGVGEGDPRLALLQAMKKHLGDTGDIIVYYQSFENSRLRELARDFPEYAEWIDGVLGRVVDLIDVFKNYWYYNPSQKGSASLKMVLPAITNLSYDGMAVSNGSAAQAAFGIIRTAGETVNDYNDEMKQLRQDMLAYCKQDTFAMVEILKELRKLV